MLFYLSITTVVVTSTYCTAAVYWVLVHKSLFLIAVSIMKYMLYR